MKNMVKNSDEDPFTPPNLKTMRERGEKVASLDGFHIFGLTGLAVNSADYLEELYVTKNAHFTKHEFGTQFSRPLFNDAILFLGTDHPTYKKKRKAMSGAFFKTKMSNIAQMIKRVALRTFAEVQDKGPVIEVDLNAFTCIL
mmetsp:Transcript_9700/g.13252  ORF Transcript_9700/g.13252 Transcript_9700/m.13252 type:complete len:142 (-) Transcript_9700:1113-1538(-)